MGLHANLVTQEEVRSFLKDVLEEENLTDGIIEIDAGAGKGDGFLSSMNKIKVSGKGKVLALVIKSAPQSDSFRELMPIAEVYRREIRFYKSIYPIFKKFQMDHNVNNPFDAVVHCYATQSTECSERIALEDIKYSKGYELWDKTVQMDDLHVTAILKLYGKFHAISFALLDQQPEVFQEISSDLPDFTMKFSDSFVPLLNESIEKIKNLYTKDDKATIEGLDRLKLNVENFFIELTNQKEKYSVINHGDCWCNNMMFKHEPGTKKIVDIKLIDYQLLRKASPVLDLSYFMYCSAGKNIHCNLEKYLNIYYESLRNHMKALGSEAEKMYPRNALTNDWKKYSVFGYLMANTIIRIVLMENDEVKDITDITDNNMSMTEAFQCNIKNQDLVNQRLRELTDHFVSNGFF